MPTWNAEPFLARTLAALAAQTYPDLQVIISDDASTDRTPDICQRVAAEDSRFRWIRQPSNLGWVANTNFLLKQPIGEFFFFAFHDDLLEPTYVARLAAHLRVNPRVAVAFPDVEVIERTGAPRLASYAGLDGLEERLARARRLIVREDNWWLPMHGLFNASYARRIGGFRRHLAGEFSADWPWLVELVLLGAAERVPERLCRKIQRNESVANRWSFAPTAWYAAALSCARRLLVADLSAREKAILLGDLARFCAARRRESRAWRAYTS